MTLAGIARIAKEEEKAIAERDRKIHAVEVATVLLMRAIRVFS
jgi:hypothetical protein